MRRIFGLMLLLRYAMMMPTEQFILQCQMNQRESIRIHGFIRQEIRSERIFSLEGELIDETTLNISSIRCLQKSCPTCHLCSKEFQSSHLLISALMDENSVFIIDENSTNEWTSLMENYQSTNSMICTLHYSSLASKNLQVFSLKKTSIFGIIFLSLCIFLTVAFSLGWILLIYCRRLKLERNDRKWRQALAKSVDEYLKQIPIILFDSQAKYSDPIADDATCTICLSPFANGEPIRKLTCLHYYHLPCIDPWLVENGRCPLCNNYIVPIHVQTISARLSVTAVIVP